MTGVQTCALPISMTNLEGFINTDDFKDLTEEQRQAIFENIVVKVTHKEKNIEELTIPDENGYFHISGLFPDGYNVEIMYLGDDYDIPNLKENIKLGYSENSSQKFVFKFTKNKIALVNDKNRRNI